MIETEHSLLHQDPSDPGSPAFLPSFVRRPKL